VIRLVALASPAAALVAHLATQENIYTIANATHSVPVNFMVILQSIYVNPATSPASRVKDFYKQIA